MSDLPLEPYPVLCIYGARNGQMGLLETHPNMYDFTPRPEYSQDRSEYRSDRTLVRIVGANYNPTL